MKELRKQFEALPEIAKTIKWYGLIFNDSKDRYVRGDKNGSYGVEGLNLAWYAFQEQQKQLECMKRKYDALYNAFTVTDDARKEWHSCYMGARQREDELQENIDQINQRAIDQAAHLKRVQEHNTKLQKRLKENNLPWQDLI